MKREILFRGKTQYGEWVEGSYLQTDDNTNNPMQHRPLNLRHQIWSYWSGDWNMGGWGPMDVLPETIGQFTGLTDKNGVKIFEGDIVKTHYANAVKSDFIETVVFHNGRFCANSNISETGQWWTSLANGVPHVSFDKSVYMESCKVIGNIHDNPELVKEEAE